MLHTHAQTQTKTDRKHTYLGVFQCSECGCAITGEIKKGKYVYYHCTSGRGKCGNAKHYVREEVIDEQVMRLLKSLVISNERLVWISEALKSSHKDEKAFHQSMVKALQDKINLIQSKMAYEDKLDGKISGSFWKTKFDQWNKEKDTALTQLSAHESANKSYFETGIKILELASKAHLLYETQTAKEKQKLLKFLLSNSKMAGENVRFELKMPFSLLVESKKSENWLGRKDSNPRMAGPKPAALPLGDSPVCEAVDEYTAW